MLIYKLISKNKEQTLRFPANADELTLKQACLYEDAFNEASESFKKITDLADLSLNELSMYSIEAAKILNKVFDVDIQSVNQLSTNEEAKDLITTIIFLYAKLTKLLDYKPKERQFFIYKSEKWFIPKSVINVFTRQLENPNLTFNEVMLLLQIEHIYKEQKNGTGLYHMLLNMIAVSARRNLADTLPLSDTALKDYQMKQMKYFEDISYSVALDFRFFF